MCLAIPVRVVGLLGEPWVDDNVGGSTRRAATAVSGDALPGEHVMVDAGCAITRPDLEEAQKSRALFEQIAARLRAVAGA
jgi:hydrogenase expression/formation protein HypC